MKFYLEFRIIDLSYQWSFRHKLSILSSGMMYLTAAAWEEALTKEKAKVKELEEKYHTKILENGVK